MNVPTEWLQDYLSKKLTTKQMAEALEANGVEIEQIMYAQEIDEQIIVVEVKKVIQHPNADKLKIAIIDTGSAEIRLVCGGPNLKTGQKLAFAQVGSRLPDGSLMKEAVIRGEKSPGMLATATELGLGGDASNLLILPSDSKPGVSVGKLLSQTDVVDVTTQANRFDLLSYIGLAREIAAKTGSELKLPPISKPKDDLPSLEVKVEAKEAVKAIRTVGISLDQQHGTSPTAKARLEAAGQRSINLAVDITNYTMLETGQPLHAFDADKLKLPLSIRFAKPGEKLTTLDCIKRQLTSLDLVIADARGPLDLAGIIGGKDFEVEESSKNLILVSGTFDATTIRKTAKRHGIRTEASARFERALAPELGRFGLERCLFSFEQAAAAKQTTAVCEIVLVPSTLTRISVDPEHISRILSLAVSKTALATQLGKFGFETKDAGSSLEVAVPWWRPDVSLAEDLAEEYIRLVGFDGVESRLPKWQPSKAPSDDYWAPVWQAKACLAGLGLFDVITYSFVSQDQIKAFGYKTSDHLKLKNPMSQEQAYLRRNLLPSLYQASLRNQNYRDSFGLYEISRVFIPTKPTQQPTEPTQLAVLCKSRNGAYTAAKEALDGLCRAFNIEVTLTIEAYSEFMPNRSASIKIGTKSLGRIGELHPRYLTEFKSQTNLAYLEIDLLELIQAAREPLYQPISRYPSLLRDLTVIIPTKVMWQDVAGVIADSGLAKATFLNDYYDANLGASNKTLAMRLEMSSLTGTLTTKEASDRLAKIEALLKKHFGASTR